MKLTLSLPDHNKLFDWSYPIDSAWSIDLELNNLIPKDFVSSNSNLITISK